MAGWPHECVVARCRVSERQTRVRSVPAAGGSGRGPGQIQRHNNLFHIPKHHRWCSELPRISLPGEDRQAPALPGSLSLASHGRDYMAPILPQAQDRNAHASFKKFNAKTQRNIQPRASVRACWRTAAPEGRKSAFPARVASGRPASLEAEVPCQCTSSYELEECEGSRCESAARESC